MASGDDDLLLHKISKHASFHIKFIDDKKTMVFTQPCVSLREFMQQRLRWASKTRIYSWRIQLVLLFIYLFLMGFIVAILSLLFQPAWPALVYLGGKLFLDYHLLSYMAKRQDFPFELSTLLITEFFQPLYISVIALLASFVRFEWKGRLYKHGKVYAAKETATIT